MAEEVMDNRSEPKQNVTPDADSLQYYYGKLFPYAEIFRWMSYGHDGKHPACDQSYFKRREFSFTLNNGNYIRNQSFSSADQIQSYIKEKCSTKFDIGAVYNVEPAKRNSCANFIPVEKELVFNIDITDYDDIRYCCSGVDVCLKCWPLMTVAIKVIDTSLRVDFGFKHILWVFSGRGGVHCWVCDGRARRLTNELRSAIMDYFQVFKGNKNSQTKGFFGGTVIHPLLVRSYINELLPFFEKTWLRNQDLFVIQERFEKIFQMIPDESFKDNLRGDWLENRRSSISKGDSKGEVNFLRWEQLNKHFVCGKPKGGGMHKKEIVFRYTYPRIDIKVSKDMIHLLKTPFCVHPKTGRVCVPIDPKHCEDFDPTAVPTLSTLLEELNSECLRDGNGLDTLGKSVEFFKSSFLQPLLKSCKEEMESSYNEKLQQKKDLSW